MRRLNVLLPDAETCKTVVSELKQAGISERHLHVIANITQPLDDLPEATVWQKTELAHALELGTGLGGAAGLLGGLLAVTFPPGGLVLGGGAMLAGLAAGASIGAAITALLGSHEHNHELDRYEEAIAKGALLLIADVPKKQVGLYEDLIREHHPEATIGVGEISDSSLPARPQAR